MADPKVMAALERIIDRTGAYMLIRLKAGNPREPIQFPGSVFELAGAHIVLGPRGIVLKDNTGEFPRG